MQGTVGSDVPYFVNLFGRHVVVLLNLSLQTFCVGLGLLDAASVDNMLFVSVYIWHHVYRTRGLISVGPASYL